MPKSFGPLSDTEKLTGRANYHNWSIRLRTILRHKDCYSGVVQLPLDVPATDDDLLAFRKRQIKAIALIQSTVHDDLLSTISEFEEDPFALWQHLQSRYESRNTQRRLVLTQTLSAVKMQGNDADEYIRRIDSIVSQLNSIGYRTPDEELIHITFKGLPSTWSHFVSNFSGELTRDPPPTYHDLVGRLHSEQFYKDGQQRDADEESNLVSRFSHRSHQHFRPRQPFQQYRPHSFSRGGGTGSTQANSQHYTNPQAYNHSTATVQCDYCSRKNHLSPSCDLKKLDEQIAQMQIRAATLRGAKHQVNLVESDLEVPGELLPCEQVELEANFAGFEAHRDYFIDSGASSHVTGDRSTLSSFQPIASTSGVSTASGARLPVVGKGILHVEANKSIKPILYVPGLTKNLLSVGKLTDTGHLVVFTPQSCFVLDKTEPKKVVLFGERDPKSRLYRISNNLQRAKFYAHPAPLKVPPDLPNFIGLTEDVPTPIISKEDLTDLWHKRLCHINHQTTHNMSSKKFVEGIPYLQVGKDRKCETCVLAKQHRSRQPKRVVKRTTRPFELVHSDLCGPIHNDTEFKYLLTFTDDYTRYTWVRFLRLKSDTFQHFKEFVKLVKTQFSHKVHSLTHTEHDFFKHRGKSKVRSRRGILISRIHQLSRPEGDSETIDNRRYATSKRNFREKKSNLNGGNTLHLQLA
jgi:hypothetical protein